MKLVNYNSNNERVSFKELKLGDVYFDQGYRVCIKTAYTSMEDEDCGSCLFWNEDGEFWEEGNELLENLITPVKSTLILNS